MRTPSFLASLFPGLVRIICLAALAACLGGCSAIKLGYNNLDDISYWWLDSYIDFSDDQTARVREDLDRLHLWHRAEELPQLAAMLRAMEQLAPAEISPAQACAFIPQARERLNAVAERAEPAVVALALSLAPEQITYLEHQFEKKNAKYRKEWVELSPSALAKKRFDQYLDRGQMIYGRLDEPQRAVLRAQLAQSIFDPGRLLAERQRRQQDGVRTLRKLAGQPVSVGEARALMRGLFERLQQSPDTAYRNYQQALFDEACRSLSALHASTTPEQRAAAARRLRAYQRDLQELGAQQ
jgi:hypothetical protein